MPSPSHDTTPLYPLPQLLFFSEDSHHSNENTAADQIGKASVVIDWSVVVAWQPTSRIMFFGWEPVRGCLTSAPPPSPPNNPGVGRRLGWGVDPGRGWGYWPPAASPWGGVQHWPGGILWKPPSCCATWPPLIHSLSVAPAGQRSRSHHGSLAVVGVIVTLKGSRSVNVQITCWTLETIEMTTDFNGQISFLDFFFCHNWKVLTVFIPFILSVRVCWGK